MQHKLNRYMDTHIHLWHMYRWIYEYMNNYIFAIYIIFAIETINKKIKKWMKNKLINK